MTTPPPENWIRLQPSFLSGEDSFAVYSDHARRLVQSQDERDFDRQRQATRRVLESTLAGSHAWPAADRSRIAAAIHVLTDLALQRWRARVHEGNVEVRLPDELRSDLAAEKARVRRQELLKRDEQLATGAVRKFITGMERNRLHHQRFVSIFSLMRDGRELAEALLQTRNIPRPDRAEGLREVTDPYLQFVSEDGHCEHTGMRLHDIWRYFRHTWTNQYTSIPGRSMMFLVRDRAAPTHPVVGIGALGSPIAQIRERDEWIGWQPTTFLEQLSVSPTPEIGEWLRHIVGTALAEIYTDDLLEEEVLSSREFRHPTEATLARLRDYGAEHRKLHHRFARSKEHKDNGTLERNADPVAYWVARARTQLFRSKRALILADLLRAQKALDKHLGAHPTAERVAALIEDREGRRATAKILRKAKADRMGIAMADVTVCGAVPPYNPILGGKLLAMLAASPEIVEAYRSRYGDAESEIASSIAGRPIVRPAELVFLGTTSLYGVGSSQYNRVRVPADRVGGRPGEMIRYLKLGRSETFGTSHYSSETVQHLVDLVQRSTGGQRVNSIFGEGVSPKLRKIRNGLDELGLPSNDLLRHGRSRIVYGVSLVRNVREYLLGMDSRPHYLFSKSGPDATATVAHWWRERWLARRIESDKALQDVAAHTLVRPIRHGARVPLPPPVGQSTIFDDL